MASCSDFAHSSAAESGSSVREVPHCWIMQVCAKDEKWYTWQEWQGYYGEYAEKLWGEAIAQGDFKSDSSIRPTATACAVPTNAATKQISHDEEKRGPQVAELWVSRYRTTELIALQTVEARGEGYLSITEGEHLTLSNYSTVCVHKDGYQVMEVLGSVPRYNSTLQKNMISCGFVRPDWVACRNMQ